MKYGWGRISITDEVFTKYLDLKGKGKVVHVFN
jgi:hypothetical protein